MQFLVLIYHNIAYTKISDCLKIKDVLIIHVLKLLFAVGKNIKINKLCYILIWMIIIHDYLAQEL